MHGYNNDIVLYNWPLKILINTFKGCNNNDNRVLIMNSFSYTVFNIIDLFYDTAAFQCCPEID